MNFAFQLVLGIAITAALTFTFIMSPDTGLVNKAETSHQKSGATIDKMNDEFQFSAAYRRRIEFRPKEFAMKFSFEMIILVFFISVTIAALTLEHADSKNESYLQTAATEAMLKVPPSGYITPQIQQDIRDFLQETRGMNPSKVSIEGSTDISDRKVRGSSDEMIEISISYPRKIMGLFGGIQLKEYRATRQILTEYRP